MRDKRSFYCPTTLHIALIKHELLRIQDRVYQNKALFHFLIQQGYNPQHFRKKQEYCYFSKKELLLLDSEVLLVPHKLEPCTKKTWLIKISKPKYLIHHNHWIQPVLQSYLINTIVILLGGTSGCQVIYKEKEGSCQQLGTSQWPHGCTFSSQYFKRHNTSTMGSFIAFFSGGRVERKF